MISCVLSMTGISAVVFRLPERPRRLRLSLTVQGLQGALFSGILEALNKSGSYTPAFDAILSQEKIADLLVARIALTMKTLESRAQCGVFRGYCKHCLIFNNSNDRKTVDSRIGSCWFLPDGLWLPPLGIEVGAEVEQLLKLEEEENLAKGAQVSSKAVTRHICHTVVAMSSTSFSSREQAV